MLTTIIDCYTSLYDILIIKENVINYAISYRSCRLVKK